MTGENFKRLTRKAPAIIKVSKSKEKQIRKKIFNLRNELEKEYLDLNISDSYIEDKEQIVSRLIDSLY
jgi:hypothetical protein